MNKYNMSLSQWNKYKKQLIVNEEGTDEEYIDPSEYGSSNGHPSYEVEESEEEE